MRFLGIMASHSCWPPSMYCHDAQCVELEMLVLGNSPNCCGRSLSHLALEELPGMFSIPFLGSQIDGFPWAYVDLTRAICLLPDRVNTWGTNVFLSQTKAAKKITKPEGRRVEQSKSTTKALFLLPELLGYTWKRLQYISFPVLLAALQRSQLLCKGVIFAEQESWALAEGWQGTAG